MSRHRSALTDPTPALAFRGGAGYACFRDLDVVPEGFDLFTGIIECEGTITYAGNVPGGRRLRVDVGPMAGECVLGASIAVSGVCLTAARIQGREIDFDVITETLDRTALGGKNVGDSVNLERSLRVGDRLDGHFVQGHVDGTATADQVMATARETVIWLTPDDGVRAYMIPKGSVAVDGVSLTIADVTPSGFSVALIPTTLERTTLRQVKKGDRVNIESDILVRTIVHHLRATGGTGGLTFDTLQRAGFVG